MDDKCSEMEAMVPSPSTSVVTRKKRKVSFAPSPLSSEDSVSLSSPSKDNSPSRRSARLSRLKESSDGPKACTSVEEAKNLLDSSRMTRSRSAIAISQQEGQNSDDESICSSVSTVSSIASSSSYTSGGGEFVKRKPGRPPGAKNKKGYKKCIPGEMVLDEESVAVATEFLKKYPPDTPKVGKRRRKRKPAEVREGKAQGKLTYCHILQS